jgi:uncharacterized repeat protein (TIGR01451 family)
MNRIIATLLFALCVASAEAVTVTIQVLKTPTCTYANGRLRANVSGGTGPYTYAWSNGATTQIIDGLLPGAYSVTVTDFGGEQASANLSNLAAGDYGYMTGIFLGDYFNWGQPLCNSWTTIGFDPASAELAGPGPYTLGGVQMDTMWIPNDVEPWLPDYPVLARPLFNPTHGQTNEFDFADANGCPGIYHVQIGWPVQFPQITIDDIQGACTGTTSGSVTLSFTAEGHDQQLQGMIEPQPNGINPYFSCGNGPSTHTYSGLPAGDYTVTLFISNSSFLPSSGCNTQISFTVPDVGPTCGVVSGRVFVDNNQNCVSNSGEAAVVGTILEILPGPHYLTTDAQGHYAKVLPLGSYTVEQQSTQFDAHCESGPTPFTISAGTPLVTRNIADTSLVGLDAMVSIGSGAARPGFEFSYGLQVRNLTPTSTGALTVTLTIDPTLIYQSATPAPSSVNGNTLTWNQTALGAWQQRGLNVRTQVPPDVGLLGTVLSSTVSLTTTTNDGELSNNTATNLRTITGAYDPNDKLAYTSSGSTSAWLIDEDEWIEYTIRFQNTGTDTAFNVLITDTLPADLDPGTLIVGAASHAFTWELRDAGTLKFYFPNILLPDSNVNEPRSHGFVGFRIRPHEGLSAGDQITNIANIYFDFNPPVITEPSVLVATPVVKADVRAFLQGPFDAQTGMMRDLLRAQGLVPPSEPYTALGYAHTGGGGNESARPGTLDATGPQAIVDWVVVELRSAAQPATVLHSRAGLLRCDGRVTDKDGTSPLSFPAPAASYAVSIRHRNHLGAMMAAPIGLSPTPALIDFTDPGSALHGLEATDTANGVRLLWAGDADGNGIMKYVGAGNDRDPILVGIGGNTPTQVIPGVYSPLDINLDGQIKYVGSGNDRDPILQTIGSVVPTATRVQQLL